MKPGWHPPAALALCAVVLMLGAWMLFGMRLDGYRFLSHPFALPGARGLPGAGVFNALVFVLPGGLMAVLADGLRRWLPKPSTWRWRLGCALALLAALAWGCQGLLPLDVAQLDGVGSRWHAAAWTLWWLAAASSSVLLTTPGLLRVCAAALLAALILPGTLLSAGSWMTVLAQPLAALLWGVWMWAAMKAVTTSTRGAAACSR